MALQWVVTGITSLYTFPLAKISNTVLHWIACLVTSVSKKSKGHIWKIQQGSFVFVTNPHFYKIEGLEKENKKS